MMSDDPARDLDLALAVLQVTARRLQKVERLGWNLVAQFFGMVNVVSADTDDVAAGL